MTNMELKCSTELHGQLIKKCNVRLSDFVPMIIVHITVLLICLLWAHGEKLHRTDAFLSIFSIT